MENRHANPVITNLKHWFALYTKPRSEFKAAQQLAALGMEYYLPTIKTIRQWSDRKKKVVEPLFKSYIFVFCSELERYYAVQQDAIVKAIFFNGKPAIVPDWEIESLRKVVENSEELSVSKIPQIGTEVEIIDGPFKGVIGKVFENENNQQMLAVSIKLLRRSVIVHLPASKVKELDSHSVLKN